MSTLDTMVRRPTTDVPHPAAAETVVRPDAMSADEFSRLFSQLDALAAVEKKDYSHVSDTRDLSVDGFRAFAGEMGYEQSLVDRVLAINYPSSERVLEDLERLRSFPSAKAVQETYRSTLLDALAAAYPGERFSVKDAPCRVDQKFKSDVLVDGFMVSMEQERTVESQESYGFLKTKVRTVKRRIVSEVPLLQVNVGAISKEQEHEVSTYEGNHRTRAFSSIGSGKTPPEQSIYAHKSFEYRAGVHVRLLHPSSLVLTDTLGRLRDIMDKNFYLVTSTHDISYPTGAFNGDEGAR